MLSSQLTPQLLIAIIGYLTLDAVAQPVSQESLSCLVKCAIPAQQVLFGLNIDEVVESACEVYTHTKLCVQECPDGENTWNEGREKLVGLRILAKKCEAELAGKGEVVNGLPYPEEGGSTGRADNKITIDIDIDSAFDAAECVLKCTRPLTKLEIELGTTYGHVCELYKETETCFSGCKRGSAIFEASKQLAPAAAKFVETACAGTPENKNEPLQPEIVRAIKEDGNRSLAAYRCSTPCQADLLGSLYITDLASFCAKLKKFNQCVQRCPGGDILGQITVQLLPINIAKKCGAALIDIRFPGPGEVGNEECENMIDRDPSFCQKSQEVSTSKFSQPGRYCNWRGFKAVCAKSCCKLR